MPTPQLQWIELDRSNLIHNLQEFRRIIGPERRLLAMVKANAYGHGMSEIAGAAVLGGADWLGVHTLQEGIELKNQGLEVPVLICGYVPLGELEEALAHGLRLTLYNRETVDFLRRLCRKKHVQAHVHIKVETGTYRQGVSPELLPDLILDLEKCPGIELEGVSSHFADIEDTTDHSYALDQLGIFQNVLSALEKRNVRLPLRHMSCTAAAILFPETHFDMLRVGIGMYGLWPSKETYVSCLQNNREPLRLLPVLSWKACIAQLKTAPKGAFIGYGRTYRTTRETRLAVIPVGYSDGYPRSLSNVAHVLIRGQRAPVRGRVAMNFITADVTDIPDLGLEETAVLLGAAQGDEVSADMLARWSGTINYEIVARLNPLIPRCMTNAS